MTPVKRLTIVSFLFAVLFSFSSSAQKKPSCSDYRNYIPTDLSMFPVKRVRLVFHFIAKEDSTGTLADNDNSRDYIQTMVNHLSWTYREIDTLRPNSLKSRYQYIPDSRVRFVVDSLLWHYNDSDFNFRQFGPNKEDTITSEYDIYNRLEFFYRKYVINNKVLNPRQRDSAINVFFVEDRHGTLHGMASGLASKNWLYYEGIYENFTHGRNHWDPAQLLAHEIGHNLGLEHPFDYHTEKDLPLTPKGTTNDIMDYWPTYARALTAEQIGMVYYHLSGNDGNISDAVIRDWCIYHPDSVMHIHAGDTVKWNSPRYLWGDLVIDPGATLVVKCRVVMPPASEIRIERTGTLVIDEGAVVNSDCGNEWKGITLPKQKKYLFFFKTRQQGLLINRGLVRDIGK